VLPFFGKAEYVPELNLWVGLSASHPFSRLCALDLSAMDAAHPPVPRHTLEYLDLPKDEVWSPTQRCTYILNLGSGKFCVANFFGTTLRTCPYFSDYSPDDDTDAKEYAVFIGLAVKCAAMMPRVLSS
jgi:hypothetical protein